MYRLQDLLAHIYRSSAEGVTKWQMKGFMQKNPELAVEGYQAFTKVPISAEVKAKMDKINEIAEGNYKELVEKLGVKEAGIEGNKEWRGPDSNPMEGRWFDVYLKTADNIFDVMLKKTSAFNRKSGGKILDERAFASRVVNEPAGINENQIAQGGHMRNVELRGARTEEKE